MFVKYNKNFELVNLVQQHDSLLFGSFRAKFAAAVIVSKRPRVIPLTSPPINLLMGGMAPGFRAPNINGLPLPGLGNSIEVRKEVRKVNPNTSAHVQLK